MIKITLVALLLLASCGEESRSYTITLYSSDATPRRLERLDATFDDFTAALDFAAQLASTSRMVKYTINEDCRDDGVCRRVWVSWGGGWSSPDP